MRCSGDKIASAAPNARKCSAVQFYRPCRRGAGANDSVLSVVMDPRGIYRERNSWHGQDSAHVKYDEHQELDLPEDRYRERGYQPPFEDLPWKEDGANDNA